MSDDDDQDARKRQAITKITNAIMELTHAVSGPVDEILRAQLDIILKDLTRARFLLVEVVEPDGLLDELAQL